jgi:hypothetical protein
VGRGSATAGLVCAALVGALFLTPSAMANWSIPASPAGCASALSPVTAPLIVFPSSDPQTRSGPGALVWTAPRGCRAGAQDVAGVAQDTGVAQDAAGGSGGTGEAFGSALGENDLPGPSRPLTVTTSDLIGITAATGTALGQVVVAGAGPRASGALVEGSIAGPLHPAQPLGGPSAPLAAFSAFLGDAVVISPARRPTGWDLAVRVQRHYSDTPAAPLLLPAGANRPSALTATMDYRGDVLAVWAAAGGVYAREVAQAGAPGPVRKLGSSSPAPELQALISDDGRAMVAWRSQTTLPGGRIRTSIELSISNPATSFGRPRVLERFDDPPVPPAAVGPAASGAPLPPSPGSLRLVRLSSEAVMIAWTGLRAGRYVVRASPVSLRRGAWAPVTISDPGGGGPGSSSPAPRAGAPDPNAADAVLADLVPGPHAEALALWTSTPRLSSGAPDFARRAILAARGHFAGPGRVAFAAPETIAPPGPNGTPSAAFDPHSDQALAAWVTLAGGAAGAQTPRIAYSLRGAAQGTAAAPSAARSSAARSSAARSSAAASPLAIILSVGAALLVLVAAAWLAVARRSSNRRPLRQQR